MELMFVDGGMMHQGFESRAQDGKEEAVFFRKISEINVIVKIRPLPLQVTRVLPLSPACVVPAKAADERGVLEIFFNSKDC